MKLTLAFVLFFTFNLSASGFGQERVNLHTRKMQINEVLASIEQQTNYRFLYNDDLGSLKNKVTINAKDASVTDVLDMLLFGTSLSYNTMPNRLIVIKEDPSGKKEVRITGTVLDDKGAPLAGASVQVKGTSIGTVTNSDGKFVLSVPNANSVLVISSVGFETKEYPLNGATEVNVALKASQQVMDQVVVIGYGTANKRDLTGSIAKIEGKEIADKPNTNPVASLQGKVAGLSVVNNGTPGAAPDVRIRGTVSIGNVHPLYVVDGIFNDNIDYLNPNDIESIEILKDPSSLAIFGVKGATGVIAITTKKAKAGKTVVNFNTTYGFKKLVDRIPMADAKTFDLLFAEEMAHDGNALPDYKAFNSNTDWVDAVSQVGKFNTNNLSVSSTTQNNRFNFGLGYSVDQGIVIHEQLSKFIASFSDEAKLSKAIKIGFNFNATRINHPYNATSRLDDARKVMPQVSAQSKRFRVLNPYGLDSIDQDIYSALAIQGSGVVNPVLEIENTWDKTKNIEYRYVGNVYTDITFLKYFNFRPTWYADVSNDDVRTYNPLYYAYTPYDNSVSLYNAQTSLTQNNSDWKKFQQDYILTYKRGFGAHNLTATAGVTSYYFGEFHRNAKNVQGTTSSDLPIPNDPRFWYISSGFGKVDPTATNSGQAEYTTLSELARVLYNYKNKYFLNASLRNDASSRLLKKNRNQQFWSVGAAWELTKEDFMSALPQVNFLKLKGSIGVLGNQTASDLLGNQIAYPAYPKQTTGVAAVFGNNPINAAKAAYIANPDLKWETVHAGEAGIELNAFNNRLHFEANYYNKVTKNLMTYVSRAEKGLDDELINGGSLRNWGEEFTASWNQEFSKDFSVNVGGNITFMKNKVLSLAADLPSGFLKRSFMNNGSAEARTMVGQPIGVFYGYVVDGIYQSYADILASPIASGVGGSYAPGDFKFKDINHDGVIDARDRTIIGNPSPKFMYGGTIGANYKQLSLSIDMGGVYGNDVFRTWGSLESPFQRVNYPAFKINRWHGAGTSNWDPVNSQQERFNYNGSTYNIEDGSYFRIRNVQLAYTFAQHLISHWKITNLRVFANVQNLKTWKHNSGYTPEFGGDATAFGFDFAGGAIPRITSFGLNVTF